MLVHAFFDEDSRVRREAASLVERGRPVDVFALRRPHDAPQGMVDGVRVHRLDVQRHQGAGLRTYLGEYLAFLFRAAWAATREHRRRRYAAVQVHTLPDFLVFAALPLKLAGVPVLLDLHEAMPEFFRMRFPRASSPLAHRLLLVAERLSIASADAVITVNEALAARLVALGVPAAKVAVILNSPSPRRFDRALYPHRAFLADGTLRLVYSGALTPTYELDVVLDGLARLRATRPALPVRLELYGRGDATEQLRARAPRLGLADQVGFHGRIPLEDVPAAIAVADIGLAPTRRDPFTDLSLSTKVLEYGAMGKPVVASRLPLVERTFPAGAVRTYEPGDPDGLASAILSLVDDAAAREASVAVMTGRIGELSWEREADRLCAIIERLAPDGDTR